jgi:putative aminopeptidase FrvX
VSIPELLDRLLRAPGPSGSEERVAEVVREAAAATGAAVEADVLGSTIATVGDAGPLVALVAHVDQIGMTVTRIGDDGLLAVQRLANWTSVFGVAQRVVVLARDGPIPGVVGLRSEKPEKVEPGDLYVDIGAHDGDDARALVSPGDAIVWDAPPVELHGGRIASGALDNRASVWVALEVLRRLAAEPAACRVALVATVHEEIAGTTSAGPPLRSLGPDIAIALDVTYASDVPEADADVLGDHPLGSGPAVFRGPTMHPRLVELLGEAAEVEGIGWTIEAGQVSYTDAEVFYAEGAGIPTALVSVPIRRMHTSVETAQLSDLEAAVDLLVAFLRRLEPELDLAR